MDKDLGKAIPYGIHDLSANTGWVSVGTDHDTSAFAVATLRTWWTTVGQPRYPKAGRLLVCADSGGSNGSRIRAWKIELARFAQETGLAISVCHVLDTGDYPTGLRYTPKVIAALPLTRHNFHGEWNYSIAPRDTL